MSRGSARHVRRFPPPTMLSTKRFTSGDDGGGSSLEEVGFIVVERDEVSLDAASQPRCCPTIRDSHARHGGTGLRPGPESARFAGTGKGVRPEAMGSGQRRYWMTDRGRKLVGGG